MGVRSLGADRWLQLDDRRTLDLREKDLLTRRFPGRTFVAAPDSQDASVETYQLVERGLAAHGLTMRERGTHPLEAAGLSVQEDLCLMERRGASWVLTAGSVCFPTRWDLPSKLGCSLAEIHAPVPGYPTALAARVDRFFDRMTPGALAHRLNWSLVGESSRRLDSHRQAPVVMPTNPADDLFLRVERQTLRRLDRQDAIVFGIRIHVWPLGEVLPELPVDRLASDIETMPIEVARYKNLDTLRPGIVDWLRTRAG